MSENNNTDLTVGVTTFFGSFDTMEDYRVFNPVERALKSVKKSIETAKKDEELAANPPKVEIIVSIDNLPKEPGKVSSLFKKDNIVTPTMLDMITTSMDELGIRDESLSVLIQKQKEIDIKRNDLLEKYPNKNIRTEYERGNVLEKIVIGERSVTFDEDGFEEQSAFFENPIDNRENAKNILKRLESLPDNVGGKLYERIYKKNLDRLHKTVADFQNALQKDPNLKNSVSFKVLESNTNTGVSGNRNAIIENAKGNHLLFVDDDNKMTNMAIAKTTKLSRNDKEHIAFDLNVATGVQRFNGKQYLISKMEKQNFANIVWTHLYNTEKIRKNKIKFIPNIACEDTFFKRDIKKLDKENVFIDGEQNEPIYYYRNLEKESNRALNTAMDVSGFNKRHKNSFIIKIGKDNLLVAKHLLNNNRKFVETDNEYGAFAALSQYLSRSLPFPDFAGGLLASIVYPELYPDGTKENKAFKEIQEGVRNGTMDINAIKIKLKNEQIADIDGWDNNITTNNSRYKNPIRATFNILFYDLKKYIANPPEFPEQGVYTDKTNQIAPTKKEEVEQTTRQATKQGQQTARQKQTQQPKTNLKIVNLTFDDKQPQQPKTNLASRQTIAQNENSKLAPRKQTLAEKQRQRQMAEKDIAAAKNNRHF